MSLSSCERLDAQTSRTSRAAHRAVLPFWPSQARMPIIYAYASLIGNCFCAWNLSRPIIDAYALCFGGCVFQIHLSAQEASAVKTVICLANKHGHLCGWLLRT